MSLRSSRPLSSSTHLWKTPVALLRTSSLLMIVYAQDRRLICLDSTSSFGRTPSTRKSLIGCAHDGALTTTITLLAVVRLLLEPDPLLLPSRRLELLLS